MSEEKPLGNICSDCRHLIKEGCVPYCEKNQHKDYKPIEYCGEFEK